MTFRNLQDELVAEVGVILKDMVSKTADDNKAVGFHGYAHELPILKSDEDDEEKVFPFYIVRIPEGTTQDDDDHWHVTADIILVVHETEPGGHQHILTAIQRIADRFAAEPTFGAFRADQDMKWQAGDEDTYPYYYGAVSITFSVPKITRRVAYV